jgi:hypothetical protein
VESFDVDVKSFCGGWLFGEEFWEFCGGLGCG